MRKQKTVFKCHEYIKSSYQAVFTMLALLYKENQQNTSSKQSWGQRASEGLALTMANTLCKKMVQQ